MCSRCTDKLWYLGCVSELALTVYDSMAAVGLLALACCVLVAVCPSVCEAVSFNNAEFESTSYNGNWQGIGANIKSSNDAYRGSHSVHVYNRQHNWGGLSQYVNLIGGRIYKVIFYVKLLSNVNNHMYQDVEVNLDCKDQHGKDFYKSFGHTPHVQHGQWYAVGGVNQVPAGSHGCRIYLQTPSPTEYLVDHATLQEVTLDSNWRTAANHRIETARKADLSIHLTGTVDASSSVQIELTQLKHEFAFGSAVSAAKISDSSHHAYQKAFYDTFEWAVLENAHKWYATEPSKGTFHYSTPDHALQTLRSHGIKVRGHNVFWAVDKFVQDWVKHLSRAELQTEIQGRIQRVVQHTKGLVEHWDVNNENLHGDYYEQHTGDPDITTHMFRQLHALDPHPRLFLNEYNVLSSNEMTVALMDKARRYKQARVPIGGIGVQGHLHHINYAEIWERLNILGEVGLPVFITELGINEPNENSKATKLEDLMTLFFSHPAVEGVIFWGFWDGSIWEKDATLFTGSNATPNAAGRKLQELINKTWRTHVTSTIHGLSTLHEKVFKGDYKLVVKDNGHVIRTENFSVTSGGQSVEIHLNGQQNGHPHVSHVVVG